MAKIYTKDRFTGATVENNTNDLLDFVKGFSVPNTVIVIDLKSSRDKSGLTVCDAIHKAHSEHKKVLCLAYGGADNMFDIYADEAVRGKKEYKKIITGLLKAGIATCELPFPEGI